MNASAWLRETAAMFDAAAASSALDAPVAAAVDALAKACRARRAVLVCGNGGSAADAMHIAGELVGRFRRERPGLKAIALGVDPAVNSAWSNDYGYESALARQVEALGEAGGVAWGLSTSGDSENIVRALRRAREIGMTALAMTGAGGGRLAGVADILIAAPVRDTPRAQEFHLCLYHRILEETERRVAENAPPGRAAPPRTREPP